VPYGGGMRASGYGMRDGMKVMNLFTDLKTVDIANRSGHPSRT
jgi:hypothetical protein